MATITFLGTSRGEPTPRRFFSSALLAADDLRILIDAGEPVSHQLKALGEEIIDIDAVLLTHGHADHIGGLPMFLQASWLAGRKEPLEIFLPRELIEPLKAWLTAIYLPHQILGFEIIWRPWEEGECVIKSLSIHATPGTHLADIREIVAPGVIDKFLSYSLRLDSPKWSVVFSGDIGGLSDILPLLERPADLLVCELAHVTAAELFESVRQREIKRLVLTHLGRGAEESLQEIAELGRFVLEDRTTVLTACDGDIVRFP